MNHRLLRIAILSFTLTICRAATPQQTVSPPPQPTDSGPNDLGKVSFVSSFYGTTPGNNFNHTLTATWEVNNVNADPKECRIAYHSRITGEAVPAFYDGQDYRLSLRGVQDIAVKPYEQFTNELMANAGIVVTSISPSITALAVRSPDTGINNNPFLFTDPQLADRLAKALSHAVELCGDGNKDPF